MSDKKFHKTVIEVVVLSEEPYNPEELAGIAEDITTGDCSGDWEVKSSEEVDGPTMAKLLIAQGSDPGFFQLDEDGNPEDEDDEDTTDDD